MVEFGEKVKRLREEKGMTQQTMADHLYVTRQAVSRWECGARYPDLLTTKKIAEVLETSIDELVSGEEVKREIEKEPILRSPASNYMQTILYTLGAVSYLFISVCLLYTALAYKITFYDIFTLLGYGISMMAMVTGIFYSVRNEISPRKTGVIICTEFLRTWFLFIGVCTATVFVGNGEIAPSTWFTLICNIAGAVLVVQFFFEKRAVSPLPVYLIGALMVVQKMYHVKLMFMGMQLPMYINGTDIDRGIGILLTLMVNTLGQLAIAVLTIYQAYVLDKKRRDINI